MKTRTTLLLPILLLAIQGFGASAGPDAGITATRVQSLDGLGWTLATDPKNVGRVEVPQEAFLTVLEIDD